MRYNVGAAHFALLCQMPFPGQQNGLERVFQTMFFSGGYNHID